MSDASHPRPPPSKGSGSVGDEAGPDRVSAKGPPSKGGPPPPTLRGKKEPGGKKAPPAMKVPPSFKTLLSPKKAAPSIIGRKLHWDTIQEKGIEGTVFQELTAEVCMAEDVAGMLDVESMKRIFAGSRKEGRRGSIGGEPDLSRKIISSSRAQNVAIVVSRLPLPVEEIAQKIDSLDSTGMTREMIERVMDISPGTDELKEFHKFMEDNEKFETLRDIEKKCWPFFKTTRMKEKCRILLSSLKVPETILELKSSLDLLYEGGREVRKSQKFRSLLVAVLLWGNFVNHGVVNEEPLKENKEEEKDDQFGRRRRRAGTAGLEIRTFGFTLPSLLKLAEFKTTIDPSISSLHFIIANMIESQPRVELQRMCEEMQSVPTAAKISAASLKECLSATQDEVSFLRGELQAEKVETLYGDHVAKLKEFWNNASKQYQDAKGRYNTVTEFVGETAAYFGDAAAKTKPESHEEFFKTLALFLVRFQACVNDYMKNTRKFQNILVESAQNRGLTYIQGDSVESLQGASGRRWSMLLENDSLMPASQPSITVPSSFQHVKYLIDAPCVSEAPVKKEKAPAKSKMAKVTPKATCTTTRPGEQADLSNQNPSGFLARTMQRRASVGVARQNIVIPAVRFVAEAKTPPMRIPAPIPPTASKSHSREAPPRSAARRSSTGGLFYTLGKHSNPSEMGGRTAELSNSILEPKPIVKAKAKCLIVPHEGEGVNYNSDTEVPARASRDYIIRDQEDEVQSDNEKHEKTSVRRQSKKFTHRELENEDQVYRHLGHLIKDLNQGSSQRDTTSPKHNKRNLIDGDNTEEALEMALDTYIKRGSSSLQYLEKASRKSMEDKKDGLSEKKTILS